MVVHIQKGEPLVTRPADALSGSPHSGVALRTSGPEVGTLTHE